MTEVIQKITSVLDELQPYIEQHGGAIHFVSFADGVVQVRLQGACVGCPYSFYTLKMGIEERLKEQVPEVIEVIAID